MSKLITVFGATGNQGGSVIEALLADETLRKEFKIRAITRDTSKPAAKALEGKGVEVVSADLSSPSSLKEVVTGSHTVFLVTNYWEKASKEVEVAQGRAVTDASKAAGVEHLIFSSLRHVTEMTGGRLSHVSHFDGKAEIERYIRDSGIPATFVLPGLFMSGMLRMLAKRDDTYTLALPVNPETAKIPLFAVEADTGKFVKAAIKHYPSTTGRGILEAADYYTPARVAAEFSEVTGRKARAIQIPAETFKAYLPAPAAQELLENMLLLGDTGYYGGEELEPSKELLEAQPVTWKEYVALNKEKLA